MSRLWADRDFLRDVQYRTDANLAARQSIYAYQHPRIDLPARILDVAAPAGGETVADIGCGNGAYLAELARPGFAGRVIGADLSAELRIPGPEPVAAYVRSMSDTLGHADPERLIADVARRAFPDGPGPPLRVTTHSGCLVCVLTASVFAGDSRKARRGSRRHKDVHADLSLPTSELIAALLLLTGY